MTREEAIKIFNTLLLFGKCDLRKEETEECFKMVIKALEAQPCEDCVSRKAVLNIIKSICFSEEYLQFRVDHGSNGQRDEVIIRIKALPSVSPQSSERTEERTETHECDCISRKLMMDMGATCIAARNKDGDLVALGALDILPSVNPQQKTGHWIWCASSHKCSNCGEYVCFSHKKLLKYCPNCGAKMQEEKE